MRSASRETMAAPVDSAAWLTRPLRPPPALAPDSALGDSGAAERPGFERLWATFMWARVVIALMILTLHVAIDQFVRPLPFWLIALCAGYLAATFSMALLTRPRSAARFGKQWFYAVGLDLVMFGVLQLNPAGGLSYTPLLALPVLMASIMGTRALALGTAALAGWVLIAHSVWSSPDSIAASATDIGQAGLTGAGLMMLALLANQLSGRLEQEETRARRSHAEARAQTLVNHLVIEAMPDGVLVVDANLTVRAANPAARRMLGTAEPTPAESFTLLDDPAWAPLLQVARRTLAEGPIDAGEVKLASRGLPGWRLQVYTRRPPLQGESQDHALCVMFLQDQREAQARLRTEKLAAMGRMSAAVAHEIRNPLAAIQQANDLLEEEMQQPEQRRLTQIVRNNALRLGHIVDDVLNVARLQAQGQSDPRHVLRLDSEVRVCCDDWAAQSGVEKRLELILQAPAASVRFAHEHLRRVLVNLLDNAARHSSARAGAIQVATRLSAEGEPCLTVWSDGAALDPSVQRHLFEPFFSSQSRSSGLGLYICRELCERHGAGIGYERSARYRQGRLAEGNAFVVGFLRAPSTGPAPTTAVLALT